MNIDKKRKLPVISLIMILLFIFMSGIGVYYLIRYSQRLPVFQPVDFHPDLVDSNLQNVKSGHKVLPFKVVDQNGDTITQENYKGKIYVANFFFTRCRTICPPMMYHMGLLQEALKDDNKVMLLSFSVTPVIDSVPVLHEYAKIHQIDARKWHITTGNKKHIYNLARKSYFAALDEGDGDLQDFVHTEKFILVDTLGRIRGVYDGTNPSTPDDVLKDIRILENE